MRKHVLVLTTAAAILAFGANAAIAQAQSPPAQPSPGDHGMMGDHPGMMEMMGHGMMGGGYGRHDLSRDHGVMGPTAMRIIFALMDANGDGKLSLEEFQAAHERIFKAMDADHDGTVTLEEMEAFIQGH
jgi:EF hand